MRLFRFFRQFKNIRQKHKNYMPLLSMLKLAWKQGGNKNLDYSRIEKIDLFSFLSNEDKDFIEKTEGCVDLGYEANEKDLKRLKNIL